MRVGVLGSGLMGGKLGTIFAHAGHEVAFSYARIDDRLRALARDAGPTIITCCLPMNAADTELIIGHTSSGAETLATRVPKAKAVCAFNTVPSEALFGVFEARGKAARPSLVYCGDDAGSKRIGAELIRDAGFDPVDAGRLRIARYTEPFGLLVGQLAYEGEGGPELAYRFERFGG
jgi:8-hydroxy-5-deazaflavin:NADPH oxidoreductase